MAAPIPSVRASADACPGALRPHHAADGELVRLRVPGGALASRTLLTLAAASARFGDGRLGVTSRANLQIRGISPAEVAQLAAVVQAAGLLPCPSHERVRNIVASPLSGRSSSSRASVDALAADLDAALCLRARLAELPGRFLFAVDDGSGDVAGLGADVLVQVRGDGLVAVLLSPSAGLIVPELDAVSAALALAEAFLAERSRMVSQAWRIAELPDGPARVLARSSLAGPERPSVHDHDVLRGRDHARVVADAVPVPGLIDQTDGRLALCALLPLGLITQIQAQALAAAAGLSSAPEDGPHGPLRLTPWRRIVVRDLEVPAALAARELLAAHDLIVDDGTAWNRVTACAGRPGCANALADVHADAAAFVGHASAAGPAVHWAGCERGCGSPVGPVAVAVATGHGYVVQGRELDAGEHAWIGAR